MKKIAFETVGCRLNQYETEQIAARLTSLGLERVNYSDKADIYVLNTCTVTGRADADCRKLINRANRLNNNAKIIVTGCYVVSEGDTVAAMDGVDMVVANRDKAKLPEIIFDNFPDLFANTFAEYHGEVHHDGNGSGQFRLSRPMVKIGDGCNQRCAYCIVPRVRGPLTSYNPQAIISEINNIVDAGHHEVVLTAVHIGGYHNGQFDLAGLVEKILAETSLSRLRLSSLEPNELDDRLIELITQNPRVCRHLHLPLQSGSDNILRKMNRPYKRADYLNVIEKVKSKNEAVTIGCDLIVGFPTESEEDFAASLDILKSGWLDYGHIFSYSDRPDTKASQMSPKVDSSTIKDRNARARRICKNNRIRHLKRHIGQTITVISERTPDKSGVFWGISDNYLKVKFPPGEGGRLDIINFHARSQADDYLEGETIA